VKNLNCSGKALTGDSGTILSGFYQELLCQM